MLDYIVNEVKPDLLIWTGDNSPHDSDNGNNENLDPDVTDLRRGPRPDVGTWGGVGTSGPWCRRGGGGHWGGEGGRDTRPRPGSGPGNGLHSHQRPA